MQCPSNSLQFHAEAGRAWSSPCRPLLVTGTIPASVMSWDHDVCDICDASVQPTRWSLSDRDSCATVYSLCQRLSGTYLRMPACSFLSISTSKSVTLLVQGIALLNVLIIRHYPNSTIPAASLLRFISKRLHWSPTQADSGFFFCLSAVRCDAPRVRGPGRCGIN